MQPQFWAHIVEIIIFNTCEYGYSGCSPISVVYVGHILGPTQIYVGPILGLTYMQPQFWTHIVFLKSQVVQF